MTTDTAAVAATSNETPAPDSAGAVVSTTKKVSKKVPIELPWEHMNDHEQAVVRTFDKLGSDSSYKIAAVAEVAFATAKPAKANSNVRNALRRLVQGGWIEQVGRGLYRLTEDGKKRSRS